MSEVIEEMIASRRLERVAVNRSVEHLDNCRSGQLADWERRMMPRRETAYAGGVVERSTGMTDNDERPSHEHIPAPGEPTVPELEEDETIAPRPEEEIADLLRAEPDVKDHSQHTE